MTAHCRRLRVGGLRVVTAVATAEGRARALAIEMRSLDHGGRVLFVGLARQLMVPVWPILKEWAELDGYRGRDA